jgi:hypothetical protein
VTNSGTSAAAVFDISIPRGATGAAGSDAFVAVGTTAELLQQALSVTTPLKIGLRATTAVLG